MGFEDFPELIVFLQKAKTYKEENGLTYDDIGREIGFSRSHVNRVFDLQTFPSVQFVILLSRFMKLPIGYYEDK